MGEARIELDVTEGAQRRYPLAPINAAMVLGYISPLIFLSLILSARVYDKMRNSPLGQPGCSRYFEIRLEGIQVAYGFRWHTISLMPHSLLCLILKYFLHIQVFRNICYVHVKLLIPLA